MNVAAFEEAGALIAAQVHGVESAAGEPPPPQKTISFSLATDEVDVRIHRDSSDVPLVGVLELVSPANKDSPESRDAFISQCDSYFRDAIGTAVVDIVTEYRANLHALLMQRLGEHDAAEAPLYVAAYRPVKRDEASELGVWDHPLSIGSELPSLPLFLRNGPRVRISLSERYRQICRDLRIQNPESE